jgi:hypothetical protein
MDRAAMSLAALAPYLAEMDDYEYQSFYDTGRMPERFWPEEEAKLQADYADDKITQQELEDSLEAMMGFPA